MKRSSTPRPVKSATVMPARSQSPREAQKAPISIARRLLGRGVLELAEPRALGEGVDEQERRAAEDLRVELLLSGRVRADGRDVRAGPKVARGQERRARSRRGDEQARGRGDLGGGGRGDDADPGQPDADLARAGGGPLLRFGPRRGLRRGGARRRGARPGAAPGRPCRGCRGSRSSRPSSRATIAETAAVRRSVRYPPSSKYATVSPVARPRRGRSSRRAAARRSPRPSARSGGRPSDSST